MTIAHNACFLQCSIVLAYDCFPGTVLIIFFTLCVDFACCYCIRWTNVVWIIFSALDLDLVCVISQRFWWLVVVWSFMNFNHSWTSIWFTSVIVRLSNQFCKFNGETFFGDTDSVFVFFLNFVFTLFPFVNTFVIFDQHFCYRFLIF